MNQIPNIEEEEFENYIYHLYQQYFSLEEKGLVPTTTHCVTDSVNFEEIVVKHKEILHHQLQKARRDWLREEIGRLSSMVEPTQSLYTTADIITTSSTGLQMERNKGNNKALQTIIDRYHSELDQDSSNTN